MRVSEFLEDVVQFLKDHPKEVVILDFNEFNNFKNDELHIRLNQQFQDILGSLMVNQQDVCSLSLKQLWTMKKQIMINYHNL